MSKISNSFKFDKECEKDKKIIDILVYEVRFILFCDIRKKKNDICL